MAVTANRKVVWNILAAVHRGRRLDRSFEDHTKGLEKRKGLGAEEYLTESRDFVVA